MKFYLFTEGPLYRFYLWSGLAKNPLLLTQRRIIIICLFTWLPLLILSLNSFAHFKAFMGDIDIHVRLLISLALLIYAEGFANERFQLVVEQFFQSNIITEQERKKYEAIIGSAIRLSSSVTVEVILFLFAITIGRWISSKVVSYDISPWYANPLNDSLTLAGYWYALVSLAIFQFILLRWYYRVIIWFRFLWQVAKLKLRLNCLHPDRAGGIGFLVQSLYGLKPFLLAHSFLLAAIILNSILHTDLTVWHFKNEIFTWTLLLLFIPVIPMFYFIRHLVTAKIYGTLEYDVFANHYVTAFYNKWLPSDEFRQDKALGSQDIQSLSDLDNSFDVTAHMSILPFDKHTFFSMLITIVLPFIPLFLINMPLDKIIDQAIRIIF